MDRVGVLRVASCRRWRQVPDKWALGDRSIRLDILHNFLAVDWRFAEPAASAMILPDGKREAAANNSGLGDAEK